MPKGAVAHGFFGSGALVDPIMIMPAPLRSSAWATVLFSPGTTNFFSKPNALCSQSIAAGALPYLRAGKMLGTPMFAVMGLSLSDDDRTLGARVGRGLGRILPEHPSAARHQRSLVFPRRAPGIAAEV